MWNGTAEILKARPTSRNTRPTIRPMSCAGAARLGGGGDGREAGRAGEAVDQRGAVEQHARRQRAQHEILEARLARAHVVAADGGHHVERQALQLEAEVEGDEVAGGDHHAHAGGGQQHQHRVLELVRPGLAHVVERQEQGTGAGREGQQLHEAGEAVDHEGAVEQHVACRRAGRARATPPDRARRWRASRWPRPRGRSPAGTRPASAAPWRRTTSTISGRDQTVGRDQLVHGRAAL